MIKNYVRLPDLEFIAGSAQNVEVEVFDNSGDAYDLTGAAVNMLIGNGTTRIMAKSLSTSEGTSGALNKIIVTLTSSETENWQGRYYLQIQIMFSAQNTIIPAEMILIVHPKIRGGV
ncbi:MAG: hypothetical protein IJH37_12970 [Clostridia bacterium]|nr:hypothetical protein [Clostridia bacterium]